MSFLPPVVMEIRANAAQFLSEQGKVVAAAKATATETEKAAQKEAAAARTAAAEAKRASEQQILAAETAAKAATVAADKRIAAEARATEAQAKATAMQAQSLGVMTAEQQAAYDKQVAAADRAANAVSLAASREAQAQDKAAAAATLSAETQKKAADAQVIAAEKTATAQEVSSTRTKAALNSVSSVATKVAAVSVLALGAAAVASVDMAAKFEKSTMLLVTAGGESMGALDGVRQGILNISTSTGTSAEQVSEGMYIMEKAGIRGAAGLSALKMAAEGAKDENVDLTTMTQALTDLLLDYNTNTKDAGAVTRDSVKYTNELVAASGAAKTTMTDFAGSMSAVIPIASTANISFEQVGGAIATMTQHGQTAQQSSQNLANLIQSLVRPNNLASAAMSQLGIDTTDLAKNLGQRGLSGTLQIVDDAIKAHTKDGMVFTGTMKDNANATKAMDTIMGQMSPTMANMSKGLQDGTVTQKEYSKAAKDLGGSAGALGNQFLGLYKANSGVTDSLKAGKPAYETYAAALRDTLGNVTAMRAAQMLLMNNGREFQANIKAIGDAGHKTGADISTWADMQETLSVKMDQTKNMVGNLGIEMGTKLLPVAKDLVGGFTDLFHGFEKGDPILLGVAGIIGGALTISAVNFGISMGKSVVKTVSGLVEMGATAIAQSTLFISGMTADEVAVGQFSTKAELLGAKVKGMGGAMAGMGAAAAVAVGVLALVGANTQLAVTPIEKVDKALADFVEQGNAAGKVEVDALFQNWNTTAGKSSSSINGMDQALDQFLHRDVNATINDWADNALQPMVSWLGIGKSEWGQNDDKIKQFGESLGKLASTDVTKAQSAFQQMSLKTDGSKESLQKLLDGMPAYKSALEDQVHAAGKDISQQELLEYAYGKIPKSMQDAAKATGGFTDAIGQVHPITPALQKSLDDAGVSADGLATDLGKVLDGMFATGMKTMNTRDETIKFNQSIKDASKVVEGLVKDHVPLTDALNQSGTDFDLNSTAGAKMSGAVQKVITDGEALAKQLTGPGAEAHKVTQDQLTTTFEKAKQMASGMIIAAGGTDENGAASDRLAKKLMGIPPEVDVKTWVDTAAAQAATDALNKSLDKLPTFKNVSVNVQYTATGTAVLKEASDAGNSLMTKANFTGGMVGFAGGGKVPGRPPANPFMDNIFARTQNGSPYSIRSGEWIINEQQSKKNDKWLRAVNDGLDLDTVIGGQSSATGSRNGYLNMGSPAQAPATSTSGGNVYNTTIHAQTNATADQISHELAWALRTK